MCIVRFNPPILYDKLQTEIAKRSHNVVERMLYVSHVLFVLLLFVQVAGHNLEVPLENRAQSMVLVCYQALMSV